MPVYCVTSGAKYDKYRGPPPTPPGYQGISLGDMQEDGHRHPHSRPPDYSVALQRSRLLQSPGAYETQPGAMGQLKRLVQGYRDPQAGLSDEDLRPKRPDAGRG